MKLDLLAIHFDDLINSNQIGTSMHDINLFEAQNNDDSVLASIQDGNGNSIG